MSLMNVNLLLTSSVCIANSHVATTFSFNIIFCIISYVLLCIYRCTIYYNYQLSVADLGFLKGGAKLERDIGN